MDYVIPALVILIALSTFGFWAYMELVDKKPILPVLKKDLGEEIRTKEYTRNFTIEVLRDNHHLMNIDAELKHRIVWMRG